MRYIRLHQRLLEWEWYGIPEMTALWVHLLLVANWEDKEWRGITVHRGELVSSLSHLSRDTGLSVSQVRTCLNRLQNSKQVSIETTNQMTKITICNYDSYQYICESQSQANDTQDGNQPLREIATTEEYKDIKKIDIKEISDKSDKEKSSERLYAAYPTRCPVSGRATGKSSKDKKKLITLLAKHSEDELLSIIKRYLADCIETKTYIKNFSTFLNNLPDYSQTQEAAAPAEPVSVESLFAEQFENGQRKRNTKPQS